MPLPGILTVSVLKLPGTFCAQTEYFDCGLKFDGSGIGVVVVYVFEKPFGGAARADGAATATAAQVTASSAAVRFMAGSWLGDCRRGFGARVRIPASAVRRAPSRSLPAPRRDRSARARRWSWRSG